MPPPLPPEETQLADPLFADLPPDLANPVSIASATDLAPAASVPAAKDFSPPLVGGVGEGAQIAAPAVAPTPAAAPAASEPAGPPEPAAPVAATAAQPAAGAPGVAKAAEVKTSESPTPVAAPTPVKGEYVGTSQMLEKTLRRGGIIDYGSLRGLDEYAMRDALLRTLPPKGPTVATASGAVAAAPAATAAPAQQVATNVPSTPEPAKAPAAPSSVGVLAVAAKAAAPTAAYQYLGSAAGLLNSADRTTIETRLQSALVKEPVIVWANTQKGLMGGKDATITVTDADGNHVFFESNGSGEDEKAAVREALNDMPVKQKIVRSYTPRLGSTKFVYSGKEMPELTSIQKAKLCDQLSDNNMPDKVRVVIGVDDSTKGTDVVRTVIQVYDTSTGERLAGTTGLGRTTTADSIEASIADIKRIGTPNSKVMEKMCGQLFHGKDTGAQVFTLNDINAWRKDTKHQIPDGVILNYKFEIVKTEASPGFVIKVSVSDSEDKYKTVANELARHISDRIKSYYGSLQLSEGEIRIYQENYFDVSSDKDKKERAELLASGEVDFSRNDYTRNVNEQSGYVVFSFESVGVSITASKQPASAKNTRSIAQK